MRKTEMPEEQTGHVRGVSYGGGEGRPTPVDYTDPDVMRKTADVIEEIRRGIPSGVKTGQIFYPGHPGELRQGGVNVTLHIPDDMIR